MSREIIVLKLGSPVAPTPGDVPDAVHVIDGFHCAGRTVTDE